MHRVHVMDTLRSIENIFLRYRTLEEELGAATFFVSGHPNVAKLELTRISVHRSHTIARVWACSAYLVPTTASAKKDLQVLVTTAPLHSVMISWSASSQGDAGALRRASKPPGVSNVCNSISVMCAAVCLNRYILRPGAQPHWAFAFNHPFFDLIKCRIQGNVGNSKSQFTCFLFIRSRALSYASKHMTDISTYELVLYMDFDNCE